MRTPETIPTPLTTANGSPWSYRLKHLNWALWFGGLLVVFMLILAWQGPTLAPKNPMQENYALKVDGQIKSPPYAPFSVPGYPLGTDRFGRDILSRVLWGIRPTMIMVLTVAAVRMVLGILLGLIAGWSTSWLGRFLNSLLSLALSIPLIIVALIGITAVGIHRGLWAFILGLTLTGWAETARMVSEQTRLIRSQIYIEAAQALGASDIRILALHVLRQIMSLVWMLLAFEVSATLFVVAELGFLGYYIGGGIWIEVSDFVAVNTSGLPELGQMLSTALVKLTDPTGLIVTGGILFLAILGFNLLGEGLRAEMTQERLHGRRPFALLGNHLGPWVEENVSQPATGWLEDHAAPVAVFTLALIGVAGAMLWVGSRPQRAPIPTQSPIQVPGGALWGMERHDPQGTLWIPDEGPADPRQATLAWKLQFPTGLVGGPAITADGTLLIFAGDQQLHAVSQFGKELWRASLPEPPLGYPAIGPSGDIYVVGKQGGLAAFSSQGVPLWSLTSTTGREGSGSPIVSSTGTIYYTMIDSIQAVSPEGTPLWNRRATGGYVEMPPRLSPQEGFIFLKDSALAAASGAPVELQGLPQAGVIFQDPIFFSGGDGQTYYRFGHEVVRWWSTQEGLQLDPPLTWDYQSSVVYFPSDEGVTADQLTWMFYATEYADTRLVWLDRLGKLLGNLRLPERNARMLGIDRSSVAYFCTADYGSLTCHAFKPGSQKSEWDLRLVGTRIVGGALVANRLYVLSQDGFLYAIGFGLNQ